MVSRSSRGLRRVSKIATSAVSMVRKQSRPTPMPGAFPESFSQQSDTEHPIAENSHPSFQDSSFRGSSFPDEDLYQPPRYRYPHTLSFLGHFSPEDEDKMIRQLQEMDREHINTCGLENYATDLRAMGFGRAVKNLGLAADTGSQAASFEADRGSDLQCGTQLAQNQNAATEQVVDARVTTEPPKASSTGGQDNYAGGSDTEEDSDAEEFVKKYIGRSTNPVIENPHTVFGEGFIVNRSMGGGLHVHYAPRSHIARGCKASPATEMTSQPRKLRVDPSRTKHHQSSNPPQKPQGVVNDVQYPILPSVSASYEPFTPQKNVREERRRIPEATPYPGLPPIQPTTPLGYDPSYRPRYIDDTRFNQGSAGVNPLGAHARPITKTPNAHSKAGNAIRRHHRLVSGSFGSFEVNKPSRFDERNYRLLQRSRKKDG
jgi:hypothetical protein